MKYVVLVPDGMADYPIASLNGYTPLEVAKTPNFDMIANKGMMGMVKTVPHGFTPASDVANLSLFGYDPRKYYPGRAPLEAANLNVELGENDLAFRCNLVTIFDNKMVDYSAGHITSAEAHKLIRLLDEKLGSETIKFFPGTSYRHLLVIKNNNKLDIKDLKCTPPHDITGKQIKKYLPKGSLAETLTHLMEESTKVLSAHEINFVRVDLKENPANSIWLWGFGQGASMESFYEKYGLKGAVISAVDLIKGIGKIVGLKVINVEGATGYYDTNYAGKSDAAIEVLKKDDYVYVHVEAPDEAGHNGDLQEKILAIERFDQQIVGKILNYLEGQNCDYRLLVVPDHATPIELKTHTADPVPFAMIGKNIVPAAAKAFSEAQAKLSDKKFDSGEELIKYFIKT
ncbi:MAG: cofactor-independent phosphoglycerate mutase [Candidatus Gygaella obscura]|nr:cofactor-independent phosphoglycerate mutase [Candidatus Gygaella obscura]